MLYRKVDTNLNFASREKDVEKFWADYKSRIHIETFCNAKEFLTFFSPKIYQLVILGGHMKRIANLICATNIRILFLKSDCEEEL